MQALAHHPKVERLDATDDRWNKDALEIDFTLKIRVNGRATSGFFLAFVKLLQYCVLDGSILLNIQQYHLFVFAALLKVQYPTAVSAEVKMNKNLAYKGERSFITNS